MEGRRGGRGRGRGRRQPQGFGEEQGIGGNQNPEAGDQVATAITRMTNILAQLVNQQGQGLVNQQGNHNVGEDKALERFHKFNPPKFLGGPNPDIAENWLDSISNIFADLGCRAPFFGKGKKAKSLFCLEKNFWLRIDF